jgi:TPR repeat protein
MAGIAISYRRDDTGWITGRIFDRLKEHYEKSGRDDCTVFMDYDSTPVGEDFRDYIKGVLDNCGVLLAVIGPQWMGEDAEGGPRIMRNDDWVRIEIETALRRNIAVVPVLIDRTPMPSAKMLPEGLHDLVHRQAAVVDTQVDFNSHMNRLIREIDRLLNIETQAQPSPQGVPSAKSDPWRQWGSTLGYASVAISLCVLAAAAWFIFWGEKKFDQTGAASPSVVATQSKPEAPVSSSAPAEISECDRLAAGPYDTTRPVSIAGVLNEQLSPAQAVPACRAAFVLRPGDPRIAFQLARALAKVGERSSDLEAVGLLVKAADAGHAAAMNALGVMYQNGRGVARDEAEAVRWYQKASGAGDMAGMTNLAGMFANGRGGVPKNEPEALRMYRQAADGGNADAMISLGTMYRDGSGVPKNEAEALRWYLRAANANNGYALTAVGYMYRDGTGVAKDPAEAARWFRKAAEVGNAVAMTQLGIMYRDGLGVGKDEAEAVRWFRKAVDANPFGISGDGEIVSGPAMAALGFMYRDGRGVVKDQAEAVHWFRKAAEAGNKDAAAELKKLKRP